MKKHNPIVSIATTALLIIIVLSFSFTAHAQNSWRHLYATTDYPEAIEFVSNTTGFAVGANGYLIKTTDGGITWDTSSLSLTDTITAIAFADANKGLIVTSAGFIYRTVDAGVNWDSVGSNGTSDPFHDVVFPNTGTAYAGGDGFFATKLYNSTDGGATWVQKNYTGADIISIGFRDGISGFLTNVNGEVQATNNSGATWIPMILASSTTYYDVEFSSSLVAYACGSGGKVIKTVNAGVSWDTLITGTTEQLNKIHTFSDDSLHIAGVNGTLLVTSNGGASWSSGYAGTEHLYDLAYGPDSSYALSKAGSTGNILKYTIPPIDTTSIVSITHYQLNNIRIQPNPFSQSTELTFDNPEKEILTVKLFDLSGRAIRKYIEVTSESVLIERKDLKQGIYFYQISGEEGILHTGKFSIVN